MLVERSLPSSTRKCTDFWHRFSAFSGTDFGAFSGTDFQPGRPNLRLFRAAFRAPCDCIGVGLDMGLLGLQIRPASGPDIADFGGLHGPKPLRSPSKMVRSLPSSTRKCSLHPGPCSALRSSYRAIGKEWDAEPCFVAEDPDDEGEARPLEGVLWRTERVPGTHVMLDRQKVERFICLVKNDEAKCLLDLSRVEQDAFWQHVAQFLHKYQVELERVDVSHGSWMETKCLHVKLTVHDKDKASYVQLHDRVSKTPFAMKKISKRR